MVGKNSMDIEWLRFASTVADNNRISSFSLHFLSFIAFPYNYFNKHIITLSYHQRYSSENMDFQTFHPNSHLPDYPKKFSIIFNPSHSTPSYLLTQPNPSRSQIFPLLSQHNLHNNSKPSLLLPLTPPLPTLSRLKAPTCPVQRPG